MMPNITNIKCVDNDRQWRYKYLCSPQASNTLSMFPWSSEWWVFFVAWYIWELMRTRKCLSTWALAQPLTGLASCDSSLMPQVAQLHLHFQHFLEPLCWDISHYSYQSLFYTAVAHKPACIFSCFDACICRCLVQDCAYVPVRRECSYVNVPVTSMPMLTVSIKYMSAVKRGHMYAYDGRRGVPEFCVRIRACDGEKYKICIHACDPRWQHI